MTGTRRVIVSGQVGPIGSDDEMYVVMAEYRQIARRYRLLPHERLNAKRVIRYWYGSERPNPGWARERGPVEFTSIGAIQCWAIPGAVLVVAGIGLVVGTGGADVAYNVGYVGLGLLIVGMVRGLPLLMAVRRFQTSGDWRPGRMRQTVPAGGRDTPPRPADAPEPYPGMLPIDVPPTSLRRSQPLLDRSDVHDCDDPEGPRS